MTRKRSSPRPKANALTRKRWLLGVAAVFFVVGVLFGVAGFLNWNLHADALTSRLA